MKQESAKPYFAKQESAKTGIRNLLNHTLLNCTLPKQLQESVKLHSAKAEPDKT